MADGFRSNRGSPPPFEKSSAVAAIVSNRVAVLLEAIRASDTIRSMMFITVRQSHEKTAKPPDIEFALGCSEISKLSWEGEAPADPTCIAMHASTIITLTVRKQVSILNLVLQQIQYGTHLWFRSAGASPLPSDDRHSLTDLPKIGVNLDEKHGVYIGGDDTLSRLLVFDNEGFSRKNYDSIH